MLIILSLLKYNDRTLLAAIFGPNRLRAPQPEGQVLAGHQIPTRSAQIAQTSFGAVLDVQIRQPLHQVALS